MQSPGNWEESPHVLTATTAYFAYSGLRYKHSKSSICLTCETSSKTSDGDFAAVDESADRKFRRNLLAIFARNENCRDNTLNRLVGRLTVHSPLFSRKIVDVDRWVRRAAIRLGSSMRAKLGRVQNARWHGVVVGAAAPLHPHAINPTATTHAYFCTLPSFARIKRPRWRPVELNVRHLRSHGKIGDCEQSSGSH